MFVSSNNSALTGDTLIELSDGTTEKLENVYHTRDKKIVTINPHTFEKSVTNFHKGSVMRGGNIIEIELFNGNRIKCSQNHCLLSLEVEGDIILSKWTPASKLQTNHSLLVLSSPKNGIYFSMVKKKIVHFESYRMYNVVVNSVNHSIIANGTIAGDFDMINS